MEPAGRSACVGTHAARDPGIAAAVRQFESSTAFPAHCTARVSQCVHCGRALGAASFSSWVYRSFTFNWISAEPVWYFKIGPGTRAGMGYGRVQFAIE